MDGTVARKESTGFPFEVGPLSRCIQNNDPCSEAMCVELWSKRPLVGWFLLERRDSTRRCKRGGSGHERLYCCTKGIARRPMHLSWWTRPASPKKVRKWSRLRGSGCMHIDI